MFCPNCRKEIEDGVAVCPFCGAPTAAQQPAPQPAPQVVGSAANLRTNRGLIKAILLSAITFGIYGLIMNGNIADDVNTVCSRYDGKKTTNFYLVFFLLGPITLEIYSIVWLHKLCNRIGDELNRRQLGYSFSAKDLWLWCVLGSLIVVGPFIFMHKQLKAMNLINDSYNHIG